MSGIFGVIDPDGTVDIPSRLTAMGAAMTHQDWYVSETYSDPRDRVGLGRIGIGIFNRATQPLWNADHTAAIFMAGEFHDVPDIEWDSNAVRSDEALALHLYQIKGKRFVEALHGAFALAIWDTRSRQLIVANDRFGLYPTYLAQVRDRLVFAAEVKGVLQDQEVDRRLREDAVAEYMRFQRLLHLKTFFAGVNLMPPASILTYDCAARTVEISRYWSFDQVPILPQSITHDEAVEEGARLLRAAVRKMCRPGERIGVYVSGGLDSRGILGASLHHDVPIKIFTFGQPDCRDMHYAKQIARAAHVELHPHYFEDGNWIKHFSDLHLRLTEGFHPWMHMHGISMLPEVRQNVDINLSGLGDLIWTQTSFVPTGLVQAPDDIAFADLLYRLYIEKYNWPGLTEAEEHSLYQPDYYKRVVGSAYNGFHEALEPYAGLPYPQRASAFNTQNHFSRHLLYHVLFGRSHVEYRLPYFDLDLQVFCYGLPYELGMNRQVQRQIIAREFPALARVPLDSNQLPINSTFPQRAAARVVHKVKHAINEHVRHIFLEYQTLYADYEGWLKTDLHDWAKDILTSEQTLSRGIFNPDGLRSLLTRAADSREQWTIGKVAPIMTFEMLLRQFDSA
ncbi:MAG: asparagine synthase [Anaerolineae bacterium]|nr:asparagine synthase [Anaerolineae bacterium]